LKRAAEGMASPGCPTRKAPGFPCHRDRQRIGFLSYCLPAILLRYRQDFTFSQKGREAPGRFLSHSVKTAPTTLVRGALMSAGYSLPPWD